MPLAIAHTTLMLPEALVIESLLEAHGIRFSTPGKDIVSQCPHLAVLFDGISILVDEEDLENARALIADVEDVPGYKSIESDGFEKHPIRNAVLGFMILLMGAPFPFWYRRAGSDGTVE
jgi:putative signal transducing protein